jgi:hypothetical protein
MWHIAFVSAMVYDVGMDKETLYRLYSQSPNMQDAIDGILRDAAHENTKKVKVMLKVKREYSIDTVPATKEDVIPRKEVSAAPRMEDGTALTDLEMNFINELRKVDPDEKKGLLYILTNYIDVVSATLMIADIAMTTPPPRKSSRLMGSIIAGRLGLKEHTFATIYSVCLPAQRTAA